MAATQGSIDSGHTSKPDKTRRGWTDKEEEVLLACLKELVAKGYKRDNGFKPGYARKLEIAMQKALPGTDLRLDPHISSRISVWKKNYASLLTILNTSGVGFNLNGDNKVNCDPEQWEDLIRSDKNAKVIRKHSWPLLEGWKLVFGKDRATGEPAEDVMDAVNTLFSDHNIASQGKKAENFAEKEKPHDIHMEAEDTSVCQSTKDNAESSKRKKKRKIDEGTQSMCDLLGQIHRDTNARLESLASRIGVSADLSLARKQVFELIKKMPGLSTKESFRICDKLIEKAERLEFFMCLPEESRHEYVIHMLDEF